MDYEISSLGLWALPVIAFTFLLVATVAFLASRYKRCPSDMILVVFGKVGQGQSARCIHGGGTIIWPLIQDFSYMSLTPMTIAIPLQKALSLQNIRINVPSTFTVGISTEPGIMQNAAERLLNQAQQEIEEMAMEIIFGQLRLTVASLTIEQINQDRESFLESIRENVSPELNKIGLYLINVNITDITDESGYIDSIGKKAASEAINQAKVDVAEQDKLGAIGEASAYKEKDIKVAQNSAQSEKGQKEAEADKRIFIQQQESNASIGEADANRQMEIKVAENLAEAVKGKKKAEADQRIFVQSQESEAVSGENKSKAEIAQANADLHVKQAEALQQGEVAKRQAEAEIQKAQYLAELERLNAEEVAVQEVEKRKVEIAAEAEAEKIRREAKGKADATLMQYEAEAKGIRQVLEGKAEGYRVLVDSTGGDAKAAATMLLLEKLENIVETQIEAIKNLKIDKVTVWDGGGNGDSTSTANFFSNMVKSLPPLQDITKMAGLELPEYLGKMKEDEPATDKTDTDKSTETE
ncbi:flotillin family protein [Pseudodesulfovibrio sediminis]|uniref:Flotillin n=1 Tax=Pseudodesulfovibrio sediminis TaxID=2810563 RepID=A0ABM7P3L4_9BACT|nr:flotillin family protein [Pseudodesulfovibrio sediminis]BCS87386.1 flotillin [Pseudodesulfovibrio sediminis]